MARTSNRTDLGIKKQKPFTGNTAKGMKFFDEWVIPKTPVDVAFTLMGGPIVRGAAKGTKKIVKAVTKPKKVTKTTKKK